MAHPPEVPEKRDVVVGRRAGNVGGKPCRERPRPQQRQQHEEEENCCRSARRTMRTLRTLRTLRHPPVPIPKSSSPPPRLRLGRISYRLIISFRVVGLM